MILLFIIKRHIKYHLHSYRHIQVEIWNRRTGEARFCVRVRKVIFII